MDQVPGKFGDDLTNTPKRVKKERFKTKLSIAERSQKQREEQQFRSNVLTPTPTVFDLDAISSPSTCTAFPTNPFESMCSPIFSTNVGTTPNHHHVTPTSTVRKRSHQISSSPINNQNIKKSKRQVPSVHSPVCMSPPPVVRRSNLNSPSFHVGSFATSLADDFDQGGTHVVTQSQATPILFTSIASIIGSSHLNSSEKIVELIKFYKQKNTMNFDVGGCGYVESEQIRYTQCVLFGIKYDDVFTDKIKEKNRLDRIGKRFSQIECHEVYSETLYKINILAINLIWLKNLENKQRVSVTKAIRKYIQKIFPPKKSGKSNKVVKNENLRPSNVPVRMDSVTKNDDPPPPIMSVPDDPNEPSDYREHEMINNTPIDSSPLPSKIQDILDSLTQFKKDIEQNMDQRLCRNYIPLLEGVRYTFCLVYGAEYTSRIDHMGSDYDKLRRRVIREDVDKKKLTSNLPLTDVIENRRLDLSWVLALDEARFDIEEQIASYFVEKEEAFRVSDTVEAVLPSVVGNLPAGEENTDEPMVDVDRDEMPPYIRKVKIHDFSMSSYTNKNCKDLQRVDLDTLTYDEQELFDNRAYLYSMCILLQIQFGDHHSDDRRIKNAIARKRKNKETNGFKDILERIDDGRYNLKWLYNIIDSERLKMETIVKEQIKTSLFTFSTCFLCHSTTLKDTTKNRFLKEQLCFECSKDVNENKKNNPNQAYKFSKENDTLPIWIEKKTRSDGSVAEIDHYDVPDELSRLSLAEKLLIQFYSPIIPLCHMKLGVNGLRGHVCCFERDDIDGNHFPHLVLPRDPTKNQSIIQYMRTSCNFVEGVHEQQISIYRVS